MKAILHCDKEWGIGKKNGLMFSIPLDMKFFRETTSGKVVVMGSNTLLSFPGSKPLKNRTNIVLWPGGEKRDDCIITDTLDEFLAEVKKYDPENVYDIGGAMMYRTMLPYCSEVLVTKVDAVGGADTFFENLDLHPNFELTQESETFETNGM
ncbi:MAG: dihydrofolate reductase, partial [Oscillospiraceae bacterium]|nr:dihydrofolate reductase [Candidatus Equicaccousia limihippi]